MQEELKAYFTIDQLERAIENSAKIAVTEYMKAIEPTLSETQKTNLTALFNELNQSTPPAQAAL